MIESVSLMLELNKPKKKLCPKLEKNVKINPNIITFKLKLLKKRLPINPAKQSLLKDKQLIQAL